MSKAKTIKNYEIENCHESIDYSHRDFKRAKEIMFAWLNAEVKEKEERDIQYTVDDMVVLPSVYNSEKNAKIMLSRYEQGHYHGMFLAKCLNEKGEKVLYGDVLVKKFTNYSLL